MGYAGAVFRNVFWTDRGAVLAASAMAAYCRGASGFAPVQLVGKFPGTDHDSLFYVLRGSID